MSGRDGNREIYVMNADGSAQRNITRSAAFEFEPAWSPDGEHIVFARGDGARQTDIYVMTPDGRNQRRLTHSALYEGSAVWSP